MVSSPADSCQAHTCTQTNTHTHTHTHTNTRVHTHTLTHTHTHTERVVRRQSSVSVRAQVATLAETPHSRVTTHAAEEDDKNDVDLCVVE